MKQSVKHKGREAMVRKKIRLAREKAKAMQEPGAWAKEAKYIGTGEPKDPFAVQIMMSFTEKK